MTEKELESKLVKAVKARGGIAYKFTSPAHRSVPDRLVVMPGGRVIFIEVKAPGKGRLTRLQQRERDRLESLEAEYYLLNSPDQIEEIIHGGA